MIGSFGRALDRFADQAIDAVIHLISWLRRF